MQFLLQETQRSASPADLRRRQKLAVGQVPPDLPPPVPVPVPAPPVAVPAAEPKPKARHKVKDDSDRREKKESSFPRGSS